MFYILTYRYHIFWIRGCINDGESPDSPISSISISDSDFNTDTEADTPETDKTTDFACSKTAGSRAGPVEDTDIFKIIFEEVYEQYQQWHTTEDIDQLSAKLALTIPK